MGFRGFRVSGLGFGVLGVQGLGKVHVRLPLTHGSGSLTLPAFLMALCGLYIWQQHRIPSEKSSLDANAAKRNEAQDSLKRNPKP